MHTSHPIDGCSTNPQISTKSFFKENFTFIISDWKFSSDNWGKIYRQNSVLYKMLKEISDLSK